MLAIAGTARANTANAQSHAVLPLHRNLVVVISFSPEMPRSGGARYVETNASVFSFPPDSQVVVALEHYRDAAGAVGPRLRPQYPSVRCHAKSLYLWRQRRREPEEDEDLQPFLHVPFQPHVQPSRAQVVEHRLDVERIAPPVDPANPGSKGLIDPRLPPPVRYPVTSRRAA